MKNLKKVLALVLALSMILSTFTALTLTASAAAQPTFSDIAGTSYEDAVEVLAALGIVAGYEDGTFGGDKVVTRAEMAAFIVRALGLSAANTGISNYTDVAADHWAIGSIDIASNKKIIVGNGDGTFAPDTQVTYEAAVKMLVCALGFEVRAVKQGGWPTGYVIEGAAIGLTDGITGINGTDGCNRGVVAALLYNALEIPYMEETSFTNNNASVMEQTYKTLLWDNLKVVRYYDATITATPTQGGDSKTAAGSMRITGLYERYENVIGDNAGEQSIHKLEIGETNPDDFYGSAVIIYAKDNGSNRDQTALCILDDTASQNSFELNIADLYGSKSVIYPGDENTEGKNTSKNVKVYYKTEEDTKAQYVSLLDEPSECQIILNGVIIDDADWSDLDNYNNGTIKFIDNKTYDRVNGESAPGSDGIYEKAIVDAYFDYVVAETDVEEGIIITHNGIDITLDESKIYAIRDVEGNELKIEDLKENDVLSIYSEEFDPKQVDSSEVLNIVVCDAPIEGTITEMTSKAIFIDDTKYKIAGADSAVKLIDIEDFNLDDAGTFYLNAAGDIVYADTTAASKDYAVFYDVYKDGARKMVFNVLTSASENLELVATSSVDVVTYSTVADGKDKEGNDLYKYVKNKPIEFKFGSMTDVEDENGETVSVDDIDLATALLETEKVDGYEAYIASYSLKTGSDNQIDTIYLAGDVRAADGTLSSKFATRFGIWAKDVTAYYNKSESTLGAYSVDASTVIFDIPVTVDSSADADKIKVINKNNLTNNKTYNGVSVYEVDKNNVAKAILYESTAEAADVQDPIAIIQGLSRAKDADGEDIYKIYMIQNGKSVTKTTVDDKVINSFGEGGIADGYTAYSLNVAYSFYPGAAIIYSDDASGAIDNLIKIYPTTSYYGEEPGEDEAPYYKTEFFTTWNNNATKIYSEGCDCFIIYGQVSKKNIQSKLITIDTMETKPGEGPAPVSYTANFGTANITVVDYAFEEDMDRVSVGTASDIKEGSYVLVRKQNGTTKDIVVYADSFIIPDSYLNIRF